MTPVSHPAHPNKHAATVKRASVFSKVFRWQAPDPAAPLPEKVEIAGSFNAWQKAPLKYDGASRIWTITLENIPGNRTHNYMLFVNGQPTSDKNADGLAVPQTEEEKPNALLTPRGPRVFILFSQTK